MIKPKLLVITHNNLGSSLSGGDRIFLNILKYWKNSFDLTLLACPEAINLTRQFKLKPIIVPTTSQTSNLKSLNTYNIFRHHLIRFFSGINFCLKNPSLFKNSQYIYTASDFYGDFIFGVLAKIINPKITWICGYYLLAPKPFDRRSPYNQSQHFFRGLIYYLAQLPSVFLTRSLTDFVLVTSKPDIRIFQNLRLKPKNIFIVQGGVFIPSPAVIDRLKPVTKRKYDALFIGRLHSQKGVLELVDIWKKVVEILPAASLAIIGDGELMTVLKDKIKLFRLNQNIHVFGYMVGKNKFNIIKDSKIILHPATYDSGGMAAAEAMAWGLPGVSFDLESLKTYYPKGMIKTPCFDLDRFTQNIITLLTKTKIYQKLSLQARLLTVSDWNWQKRLLNIKNKILN